MARCASSARTLQRVISQGLLEFSIRVGQGEAMMMQHEEKGKRKNYVVVSVLADCKAFCQTDNFAKCVREMRAWPPVWNVRFLCAGRIFILNVVCTMNPEIYT